MYTVMKIYILSIVGMTCASCVGRVEKFLKKVEKVHTVSVNLGTEQATIECDQTCDAVQLMEAVERAGFEVIKPQPITVQITGMTCASCVGRVERAIRKLNCIYNVQVNLATEQAQIWATQPLNIQQLTHAIERTGFGFLQTQLIELNVMGMTCASCVGRVEKVLKKIRGVVFADVNLATEKAHIQTDASVTAQACIKAIQKAGFDATEIEVEIHEDLAVRRFEEAKELKQNLGIALILALPVFILEMGSHLIPAFHKVVATYLGIQNSWYLQCVLTSILLIFPARRFYKKGIPALLRLSPDMNSLVSVGTLSAFLYSCVATFLPQLLPNGTVHVYFEASSMIIVLILLGRYFEARAKGKTSQAIQTLIGMQPKTAHVVEGASFKELPISQVKKGMLLHIQPGEKIPVDGMVYQGTSFIDESMVTGEPIAVKKQEKDQVIAGTVNQQGVLYIEAQAVGDATLLSQIIRLVEQAQGSKLPIQSTIDKVTMWFVPVVLALALLTFIVWYWLGPEPSLSYALVNMVAVLIIACPCAMGLAVPTSIMVSTGRGAELGLLFKKGEALQQLKDTQIIALDKTGTLTEGRPQLTDLVIAPLHNREDILCKIASVEVHSEHPIAKAIVLQAQQDNLTLVSTQNVQAVVGYGVQASISEQRILIGADRLMSKHEIEFNSFKQQAEHLAQQGKTPLYVAIADECVAMLAVSDPIKPSSFKAIQSLQKLGLDIAMITGDHHLTAQSVAKQLNIQHVVSEVLPEGKLQAIEALKQTGKVAYVGDGINDAPALAHADVGIAIGTGTDVAIESADVVLMSGQLTGVLGAIELSHATIRNIHQNLFWAFIYNILLIPIAAGILYPMLLSPMFAAGAMALSSVFVLSNALRLKNFKVSV